MTPSPKSVTDAARQLQYAMENRLKADRLERAGFIAIAATYRQAADRHEACARQLADEGS